LEGFSGKPTARAIFGNVSKFSGRTAQMESFFHPLNGWYRPDIDIAGARRAT